MTSKKKLNLRQIQSKIQKFSRNLTDSDPVSRLMGIHEIVLWIQKYPDYRDQVISLIKPLLDDSDSDVRETAAESIALLQREEEPPEIRVKVAEKKGEDQEDRAKALLNVMVDQMVEKAYAPIKAKRADLIQRKLNSAMNFEPNLNKGVLICLLNIPLLISLLLTIFLRRWEVTILSWAAFLFIIGMVVRAYLNKKYEFHCYYCDDKSCKNNGGSHIMFYCNRWIYKPKLLEIGFLVAYYFAFISIILGLAINPLFWLPLIPCGVILILKLIYRNETNRIFYETPPNHPNSCIKCNGTGKCLKCKGTGRLTIEGLTSDVLREGMASTSFEFKTCTACRGLRLCPKEIEDTINGEIFEGIPNWAGCFLIFIIMTIIIIAMTSII